VLLQMKTTLVCSNRARPEILIHKAFGHEIDPLNFLQAKTIPPQEGLSLPKLKAVPVFRFREKGAVAVTSTAILPHDKQRGKSTFELGRIAPVAETRKFGMNPVLWDLTLALLVACIRLPFTRNRRLASSADKAFHGLIGLLVSVCHTKASLQSLWQLVIRGHSLRSLPFMAGQSDERGPVASGMVLVNDSVLNFLSRPILKVLASPTLTTCLGSFDLVLSRTDSHRDADSMRP